MDLRDFLRRKKPFTRRELAEALGVYVGTIDNHRARGNLAWKRSEQDQRVVLIEASEALRFAKWYRDRVAS